LLPTAGCGTDLFLYLSASDVTYYMWNISLSYNIHV
jgi:hypothetical protein